MKKVRLHDLAFARSGDKGDVSDIGIMAKTTNIYNFLEKELTAERIKELYNGMVRGNVEIYPMPNIESFEILLRQALGGGATCTLRFDQTGKSMGQALLRMEFEVDDQLYEEAKAADQRIQEQYGAGQ